jgi:hypothetical protein
MKVLDLFSGIGGFSLGLERAGMTTVAFCDIEKFPQQVLRKHWPQTPIHADIRTMEAFRTSEAPGNGYVRIRDVFGRSSRDFLGQPSIHVGCPPSQDRDARQDRGTSSQAENGDQSKETGGFAPVQGAGETDYQNSSAGGYGAGQGLFDVRQERDGYRSHRSGVSRRSDGIIQSSTSLSNLSSREVTPRQEGGVENGILTVGPIDVICGGFP